MSKLWKDFRTNFMYWRFRNITRNRLRLRSWWQRQRPAARTGLRQGLRSGSSFPRPRGTASYVHRGSSRRSLIALAALVLGLTALTAVAARVYIYPSIVSAIGTLIIVGSIYWALRGV